MCAARSAESRPRPRAALVFFGAALLLVVAGCGDDLTVAVPLTQPAGPVYLYNSSLNPNGNITGGAGTRAALDAFVQSGASPAVCTGKTRRAFITLSAGDSIANMPTNFGFSPAAPVYGALGPQLANNWADLLDGTIAATLNAATGVPFTYWTGSSSSGTASGFDCAGWTLPGGVNGTTGDRTVTSPAWLDSTLSGCGSANIVVGMCY
jgi:hypothetical protein